jgi:hypothetical protein
MLSGKLYYNDKNDIHTSSKRYGHPMILIYTLRHNFMGHPMFSIYSLCQNVVINFIIMYKISKTL